MPLKFTVGKKYQHRQHTGYVYLLEDEGGGTIGQAQPAKRTLHFTRVGVPVFFPGKSPDQDLCLTESQAQKRFLKEVE